jgi:hypothetical protein
MKRTLWWWAVLITAFVVVLAMEQALAQERTPVKVKSSVVVTGVVIVRIEKAGKPLELQCNEGVDGCKTLANGAYLMAELPKNYGKYDCKNVEIYRADQNDSETAKPIGEYCLIEK